MIKKISVLLAFVALLFTELALAQGAATVTGVVGTVNVQAGSGTPRALRMGDQVQQGDTISTGAESSVVFKFDDGEVTALAQNSRMTITTYQYERTSGNGNILLSLVTGGMRAITGLLGHTHPDRVAYRAATATIGIRGTDVTIAEGAGGDVGVRVTEGAVSVKVEGGATVTLPDADGHTVAYIHNGTITFTPSPGFANPRYELLLDMLPSLPLTGSTTAGSTSTGAGGAVTITNVPAGSGGGGGSAPSKPASPGQ
jgi:hypothetical protein